MITGHSALILGFLRKNSDGHRGTQESPSERHALRLAKVYRSFLLLLKTKMPIQVIEFASGHLSTVVQLLNDEYRDSREFIPFDEERVLSQIRRRHLKILVAEENGRVLGLVATHSHENSEEDVTWLTATQGNRPKDRRKYAHGRA